jgi:hypothetical protein
MLRRRQAMYEQGYAQVAGRYNALNRDMTNPVNREFRDNFLKQATDNLKNLSAMDLSLPQNVQAAASVFQPFYTNKAALGDMQLTQHWNQQESIAESYRLKDGGKEYSDDNINYVRMQRQQFATDNPDSWSSYYGNRRSYNPYYDYNKEVKEAMKEFKPSNYPVVKFEGLYMIKEDDKSWREAEIRKYLDGVLSDKAKQQMRIESSVRLASSPETLNAVYGDIADKEVNLYNHNIKQIDKEIALEKDAQKLAELKKIRSQFEDNIKDISDSKEKLKSGDPAYLKANADRLAYQIYYNQNINKLAKGFSFNNVELNVTPNQAAISLMEQDREDRRAAEKRRFDYNLKMLELQGVPGDFNVVEPRISTDDAAVNSIEKRYQSEVDNFNNQINQLKNQVNAYVLSKINEGKPESEKLKSEDLTGDVIQRWLKEGGPNKTPIPKTDIYYQLEKQIIDNNAIKSTYQSTLDGIDQAGYKGMTDKDKKDIQTLRNKFDKKIKLDDGTVLNGKEIFDGFINGTIKPEQYSLSGAAASPGNTGQNTNISEITINGKKYSSSLTTINTPFYNSSTSKNGELHKFVTEILGSKSNDTYKNFLKNRQVYIETNFKEGRFSNKGVSFSEGSDNAKSLENSVGSYLPPGYDIKHFMVGVTPINAGSAYYFITPKQDAPQSDAAKIADLMKSNGADVTFTQTEGGGVLYEVKNVKNRIIEQFANFSPTEKAVVQELSLYTGSGSYTSAVFTTPYGDTKFHIKKQNGLYHLYSGNNPNSITHTDPLDAISHARLLSSNGGQRAKEYDTWWGLE